MTPEEQEFVSDSPMWFRQKVPSQNLGYFILLNGSPLQRGWMNPATVAWWYRLVRSPNSFLNYILFIFLIFWPHQAACGILVPWPGIEPTPPALEVRSLNHWTTREVLLIIFLIFKYNLWFWRGSPRCLSYRCLRTYHTVSMPGHCIIPILDSCELG